MSVIPGARFALPLWTITSSPAVTATGFGEAAAHYATYPEGTILPIAFLSDGLACRSASGGMELQLRGRVF